MKDEFDYLKNEIQAEHYNREDLMGISVIFLL